MHRTRLALVGAVTAGMSLPAGWTGEVANAQQDTHGSVTNASQDTLYVFPTNCPDTRPVARPAAVVVARYSGSVLGGTRRTEMRSVRLCGPGLALDPITLTCAYPR